MDHDRSYLMDECEVMASGKERSREIITPTLGPSSCHRRQGSRAATELFSGPHDQQREPLRRHPNASRIGAADARAACAGRLASTWFAETGWPTNTHECFVWIRHGEFIHSPRLVFRRFLKLASRCGNVVNVEIQSEGVSTRYQPSLYRIGQM
jgi:hypothetical protein